MDFEILFSSVIKHICKKHDIGYWMYSTTDAVFLFPKAQLTCQ